MSEESTPDDIPVSQAEAVTTARLPALFVADLHLSARQPETTAAFLDFLSGPARQAGSLFILGDLFEYWVGDDDIGSAFNQGICSALSATVAAGTPVFFMSGNRDLLAGNGFAHATGAQLLADPASVCFAAQTLLLSHGDALCTDDRDYQAFRRQVRNPAWQADFLAKPLAARHAFIENARTQSEAAKRDKCAEIMDVNTDAVVRLLRTHGYPTLIHGHTHRPGHHTYSIDSHRCERYVLPDWRDRAVWLSYDGAEFSVHAGRTHQ